MKRKNRILPLVAGMVIILAVLVLGGGTALADSGFAGGEGTLEDPWLIETPEQLATVAEAVYSDDYFELIADINLADYLSEGGDGWNGGAGWEPIGKWYGHTSPDNAPFTGSFDGYGHKISGLFIYREEANYQGLFGYIDGATIQNIKLEDVNVTGHDNVGGLVGYNKNGTIINSNAAGSVTGTFSSVGGLVGSNNLGYISNSYSAAAVQGDYMVGGLVGNNYYGSIESCYATGTVSDIDVPGSESEGYYGGLVGRNNYEGEITNSYAAGNVGGTDYVGGLVGENKNGGIIAGSYATGDVIGANRVGGLVGYNFQEDYYFDEPMITNCYARGDVEGSHFIGGLVGENSLGIITQSYAAGAVTGTDYVGGLVGSSDRMITASFYNKDTSGQEDDGKGEPKSTAEMNTYATFFDTGWDFIGETGNGEDDIWGIDEAAVDPANGGYPFLAWQGYDHKILPAVTTGVVDGITPTSAVGHGEIINIGYPNPSQHGVVWNYEENPTLDDNKTEEGAVSGAGEFGSTISGLYPETVYYVRAYATNDSGTAYGEQVQFTTSAPATVDIAAIPGVTVPAAGGTPVTSIEETDQYTGNVSWNPAHNPFKGETVYTATITLTAKTGFTVEGVAADFFTITGAETVKNDADSGIVTAIFPETEEVGETYMVTITVKDSEGAAIEGAEITINSEIFTTDTDGVVTIELGNGTYSYSITKPGFNAIIDCSITVNDTSVAEVVEMTAEDPAPEITVMATSPDNGAAGVSLTPTITAAFNENVEADTGYGQIMLKDAGNNSINISTSISGSMLTITPDNSLSCSTAYTVTIPVAAVKSETTGANMGEQYIFSFTTRSAPSGGGGGGTRSAPDYSAKVTGGGAPGTEISIDVNARSGSAVVSLGNQAEDILGGEEIPVIIMPFIEGVDTYTLEIPGTCLCSSSGGDILTFSTHQGNLTIPGNMLTGTGLESSGDIGITIGQGDKSGLPDNVREAVGDRPVVQLTLTVEGEQENWSNPDAPVMVSIPYQPTEEELADPEHITVWYLDGEGNAVEVPNGRYDPATGTVTFATTHFSRYAVVYVQKTFDDLGNVEWARQQIEALASKGIVRGITGSEYFPSVNITRADFLYSLVRTLGVDAAIDGNFDDLEDNAYYYKEIGIAKKLGITSGTGDNRFCPDESITRQDMITLTVRALGMLGMLKEQASATGLDIFADKSLIADYALQGIATAVKEGLIIGSGDQINPLGSTTRAEAAVFLYRIYNK